MFGFSRLKAVFTRPERPDRPAWLVVGLGNPGASYAATRHNVGFRAIDEVLAGAQERSVRGVPATAAVVDVAGTAVQVARPTTFMNNSGQAVGPLAARLDLPAERVIVVHDELDLAPGVVRVRAGGSENGHNGLKSVTEHLGTRDYLRVRVGVGRPPRGTAVPDWVLSPGGNAAGTARAAEAVRLVVAEGLAAAQNVIHRS